MSSKASLYWGLILMLQLRCEQSLSKYPRSFCLFVCFWKDWVGQTMGNEIFYGNGPMEKLREMLVVSMLRLAIFCSCNLPRTFQPDKLWDTLPSVTPFTIPYERGIIPLIFLHKPSWISMIPKRLPGRLVSEKAKMISNSVDTFYLLGKCSLFEFAFFIFSQL